MAHRSNPRDQMCLISWICLDLQVRQLLLLRRRCRLYKRVEWQISTVSSVERHNLLNLLLNPIVFSRLYFANVASVVAYSKNDLTVSFQPTRTGPGRVSIQATFRNDSISSSFENVNMQAAVPRSQKLRLEPISSPTIAVGEESTQNLRITATQGVCFLDLTMLM